MSRHYQRQRHVSASAAALTKFCRRWGILRLAMFGSVLTPNFHRDSDVDMLATFRDDTQHTLLDVVRMERELGRLYRRRVDLGDYDAVLLDPNTLRRQEILDTMQVTYED
jgi:predicted nucleotidyltransferase